ncbi:MAG: hypothetical protein HOD92_15695 [Deltaproteobacteria bacterium]|jgi:copper chaperone NosL|nr:hypothetical protein [Deltaproteobacteria bacterium]
MINNMRLEFGKIVFYFLMIATLFSSCVKQNEEQLPKKVVWDRDICISCRMALSDNRYSAQIVDTKGTAYLFDDIGCAILWAQKRDDMEGARYWVNDKNSTEWIDASKANWTFGDKNTPMGYGFAATMASVENRIDFEIVKKRMIIGDTLVNTYQNRFLNQTTETTEVESHDHSGN